MATNLSITNEFSATPSAVYALLTDRAFLEARLAETGGSDPAVVSLDVTDATAKVVTRQSIPASALPSMVASIIQGDPVTERTENWHVDGDGYAAELNVVVKGAPASMKGTVKLAATGAGSALTVSGVASVPIPVFGAKIESVIAEQVTKLLESEAEYTAKALAG